MSIKNNIKKIKQELPANIILVAATKTRSVDEINQAIESKIKIIGENYVQEAEKKYNKLKGKVQFHCIGHLQKNKVKKAVEMFDMIQTVDSIKIAEEIDKKCKDINKIMPVLIEINSGKEPNKDGVMPEDTINLIKEISQLKNLKIKGLMTMAPYFEDVEKNRPYFKLTKTIFDKIKAQNIPNVDMKILSMGMSHSYKIAIEEGANMVRIGSKIFNSR
jgi:pyridoxal phosphate enzyme (YggS family)|tara:strand:- start:172 stop:825 length:654 start_codon:yes stop_codon:yes gene_type:complete